MTKYRDFIPATYCRRFQPRMDGAPLNTTPPTKWPRPLVRETSTGAVPMPDEQRFRSMAGLSARFDKKGD